MSNFSKWSQLSYITEFLQQISLFLKTVDSHPREGEISMKVLLVLVTTLALSSLRLCHQSRHRDTS